MVKDLRNTKTAMFTPDHLTKEKLMVKVTTLGKLPAKFTMASGCEGLGKVMACGKTRKVTATWGNGKMGRQSGTGSSHGAMETSTRASGICR